MNIAIKHLIAWLVLLTGNLSTAQNSIDNLLKRYRNDNDVIHYNLKGDISKLFAEQDEILFNSKVESLELILFNNGKNISPKDAERVNKAVDTEGWEMLMNVKDKSNNFKMYAVGDDQILKKVFVQVQSSDLNAYLLFKGTILFEEIAKLNFGKVVSQAFSK